MELLIRHCERSAAIHVRHCERSTVVHIRHCERSTVVHIRHCERSAAVHAPEKSWIATACGLAMTIKKSLHLLCPRQLNHFFWRARLPDASLSKKLEIS